MAGLSGYDPVYRGRPAPPRQFPDDFDDKYYNREVIRPIDITSLSTPNPDGNSSPDNGKVIARCSCQFHFFSANFYTLLIRFVMII